MRSEYLPYYLSRLVLSVTFALLVAGVSWGAAALTAVLFGFFLLYLHSGWFTIDLSKPFFPLRRDMRGQLIQRKALIAAVVVGLILFLATALPASNSGVSGFSGSVAMAGAIVAYFITQFILFARS